ncbi:MAG: DNA polymerase III subunit gamma/tau [Deltaproteobacteria bacterium]|nr:DNA polymerase III subunit gamma/tau [Deltaproteobacteria bacterium]
MSYQVLARKYRPQTFADVLGQVHVTQTLQNALSLKRIHHAYLFTGARGIGKTTVARVLAKALNCEKGISREPCNQCGNCRDIIEGKSLDVQEIDGASNTSVEDVRQIREQVKYLSATGHYKIYIIDEVHMLSTSAFNALLKTLEEPPPHVIFIFATTEVHKIPSTILSRCQRFDFRRIPAKELAASLAEVAKKEGVAVREDALHLLAHESQGSLRDAQSLLDQAIAFAGNEIRFEHLKEMFGFLDREQLKGLIRMILSKDQKGVLCAFQQFYQSGSDLNRLSQDLLTALRNLYLVKTVGEAPDWLDLSVEEGNTLKTFAAMVSAEQLDQLFQLAYRGVEETARSPYPKMIFEVLLVRMTQVSAIVPVAEILERLEKMGHTMPSPSPLVGEGARLFDWPSFASWLQKNNPRLFSILEQGKLLKTDEKSVVLQFETGSVYGEMLQEEDRKRQLKSVLETFFKRPFELKLEFAKSGTAPETAALQEQKKQIRDAALRQESVKEAANILGAVVEEVRTEFDE